MGWIKRMLGSGEEEFSGNENAEVLAKMAADGDDLSKSRDIDFTHLFSSEENAVAFVAEATSKGYSRCMHEFWKERLAWLTSIQVRMVPSLEEISATEAELNEMAQAFEGRSDGWGCMEVIKPKSA